MFTPACKVRRVENSFYFWNRHFKKLSGVLTFLNRYDILISTERVRWVTPFVVFPRAFSFVFFVIAFYFLLLTFGLFCDMLIIVTDLSSDSDGKPSETPLGKSVTFYVFAIDKRNIF